MLKTRRTILTVMFFGTMAYFIYNFFRKVQFNEKEIEMTDIHKFAMKPNGGEIGSSLTKYLQFFICFFNS